MDCGPNRRNLPRTTTVSASTSTSSSLRRAATALFAIFLAVALVGGDSALGQEGQGATLGSRLTHEELHELLVGNTEHGEYLWLGRWTNYQETFHEDGSITGREAGERYTGSSQTGGDAVCADYSTAGDGCFAYVRSGSDTYNAHLVDDEGAMGRLKASNITFARSRTSN